MPRPSKTKSIRPRSPGEKSAKAKVSPSANETLSFPVVAVGASAGGLEAFSNLLRALPRDPGLALIFLPHLDPTHESAMVPLLGRTSDLPVVQAANAMPIAPNRLFVLPPNSDMTIVRGKLRLVKREAARGHHLPIDTFFRSLAEDQANNAVGVILSGTATDGTQGLAAIKHEGGITFAQEPESAKYDGMPTSAIAAGVADFVLTPDRIARELIKIQKRPPQTAAKDPFEGKDGVLRDVLRLLKTHSKVDFSDYKSATVQRRIARRMHINQIANLGDYVRLLHRNQQEIEALYRDVLINVTSFFRNPEVFDSLREKVYPRLLEQRQASDPIRIWVPGCSTGEETYSHAIALMEMLSELRLEVPIQIFGTDLSETSIQRARTGIYKESIVADVSPVRLRRFFHKTTGGYQISKSIRDMCVFARQNVFSDPPFSRMDLISCRNVLIYLSPVLQKKVVPIFHYALKPAGFLLVGNNEGLVGSGADIFDLIERKSKIYQKKQVLLPVTFGLAVSAHESLDRVREKAPNAPREEEKTRPPADVQREADRLLLTRYVPSAVVVNEDFDILQSRGSTSRFLELPSGKVSLNLLKMARPGLLHELRTLLDQARQQSVPVSKHGVQIEDGHPSTVKLEVIPFRTPARDRQHFLVLFEETGDGQQAPPPAPAVKPDLLELADIKGMQLGQLKQELAATKEYLQSIIEGQEATNEELQSANEEIQSGNEELQSTNEELQTSKEELESANEELNTVNEEIQHRNQQLSRLSNDLINLLNSATIPMLLLGEDLRIRRYTPEAERVLGFAHDDVGKPLAHLRLLVDLPHLERWMLDVMRDITAKNEKIRMRDGKWYKLRITPYRTLENKIDGIVLMMIDISDLLENRKPAKSLPISKKTRPKA